MKTYVHTQKKPMQMLIIALFIIAKKCHQPKCSSMAKSKSKLWYIHTAEYSVIQRGGLLTHRKICVDFKGILPNEKKASPKGYILYDSIRNILEMTNDGE